MTSCLKILISRVEQVTEEQTVRHRNTDGVVPPAWTPDIVFVQVDVGELLAPMGDGPFKATDQIQKECQQY